ncbi:Sulfatase [Burkholderiales bacterium 8X]|nr:Sulfatase [Burkholderiales bacterium 8X]
MSLHQQPFSPTRRPNIVFILTDDHASHAIGAYGSVVNHTPRLDELARAGVRFDNCFATNSLCTPSRASLLTGTYSHINGVSTLVTPIDASQPTFISQLKAEGYRTAMVGKWHMGDGPGHDPEGFDYWDVLIEQGEYHNPRFLNASGLREVEGYATDLITDLSLSWVDQLEGDAPWCVLIWHKAPHRPWQPHPRHASLYTEPIPLPRTWNDDYSTRSSSARRAAMRIAEHLNAEDLKQTPPPGLGYEEEALWKYQRYMEDYLRCVAAVDDNVGRVIDWLRARGDFDDTILLYSSDQGFFLGDHGWFDKRFMYEQSMRMPLLLSYPRAVEAGQVHDGIVTNVDFAKSLLEFTATPAHPRMQGRSFAGDLKGQPTSPPAEGMYYRYWEHDDIFHKAPAHYGWRDRRYKLIYFYNDGMGIPGTGPFTYPGEWEMYDLELDPDELRNVFHSPEYRAVRQAMQAKLSEAQRAVGDAPHASQTLHDELVS